jgi:hypothetical protein
VNTITAAVIAREMAIGFQGKRAENSAIHK